MVRFEFDDVTLHLCAGKAALSLSPPLSPPLSLPLSLPPLSLSVSVSLPLSLASLSLSLSLSPSLSPSLSLPLSLSYTKQTKSFNLIISFLSCSRFSDAVCPSGRKDFFFFSLSVQGHATDADGPLSLSLSLPLFLSLFHLRVLI